MNGHLGPYPGLRPFGDDHDDVQVFFGRDAQIDALLSRFEALLQLQADSGEANVRRFVGVVGQSGCGKSSLVRAGLIPALRTGFMTKAGSRWKIVTMRPGREAVINLARALEAPGALHDDTEDLPQRVSMTLGTLLAGGGLANVIGQASLKPGQNVLLLIDQFEEIFDDGADSSEVPDDAAAFIKLVLEAARDPKIPLYALITMRSEFIGACAQFRNLAETLNQGLFLVPRLTRDQLREAIERPARLFGAEITPLLTNRLINDLGTDPDDQLPVLQHVLMRTWAQWRDDPGGRASGKAIDLKDYEAIGGTEEALTRHGEEIYAKTARDLVVERVFKALTRLDDDNLGVRRPTKFSDLCVVTDSSADDVRTVVEAFRSPDVCFLRTSTDAITDDTDVDIMHESLMRVWSRLRTWVQDQAESTRQYRDLVKHAEEHSRGETALYRDPDLSIKLRWKRDKQPTLAWAIHSTTTSDTLTDERRKAETQDYERAMRFLSASKSRRTQGYAAIGAVIALLLIYATWTYAGFKEREGTANADALAAVSLEHLSTAHDMHAFLLAAQAYQTKATTLSEDAVLASLLYADDGVLARTSAPPWRLAAFTSAPSGRLIAIVRINPPTLIVFSADDLAPLSEKTLKTLLMASSICGFEDGAGHFAIAEGASVDLYDASGAQASPPQQPTRVSSRSAGNIAGMACIASTADQKDEHVVVGTTDGSLSDIDITTGAPSPVARVPRDETIASVVASPQGRYAAALTNRSIRIFDHARSARRWRQILAITLSTPLCSGAVCTPPLAFRSDEGAIAWYDGADIHVASLPGGKQTAFPANCPPTPGSGEREFAPWSVTLANYSEINPDSVTPHWLPDLLLPERACRLNANSRRYRRSVSFEGASGVTPVFDPSTSLFVTRESGGDEDGPAQGLELRTVAASMQPMLGTQLAPKLPNWHGSYVFNDSRLVLAGVDRGYDEWRVIDLDHFRSNLAAMFTDGNGHLRLRDSGDPHHVLVADYNTGYLYVLDLGAFKPCAASAPHCPSNRIYLDRARPFGNLRLYGTGGKLPLAWDHHDPIRSMAYDPNSNIVTIAYDPTMGLPGSHPEDGVRRYDSKGELPYPMTAAALYHLGAVSRGSPCSGTGYQYDSDYGAELTQHGNFIEVRCNAEHYVFPTHGKQLQHEYFYASADERYAIGSDPPSDDPALYRLRDNGRLEETIMKAGLEIAGPSSDLMSLSGETGQPMLAEQSPFANRFQLIELHDVGGWLSSTIPDPPSWSPAHAEFEFSPDGNYLFLLYKRTSDLRWVSAVYSVDPYVWQRALCISVNHKASLNGSGDPRNQEQEEMRRLMSGSGVSIRSDACSPIQLPHSSWWFSGFPSPTPSPRP